MDDQSSVFADDQSVDEQAQTTEQTLVEALVGEGRKYSTVEELAKAYINADEFIDTLKEENNELRAKYTKAKTIDDVLERLQQQTTNSQDEESEQNGHISVSVADIQAIVADTVTGLETSKTRQANQAAADRALKERFGDKAGEIFKSVANTPELKRIYTELAQVDPQRFVALFDSVPKNTSQVDSGSSVASTQMHFSTSNRAATVGAKEYYDNVRRTNPSLYYSQQFQIDMDKTIRNNPKVYYGKQ